MLPLLSCSIYLVGRCTQRVGMLHLLALVFDLASISEGSVDGGQPVMLVWPTLYSFDSRGKTS